MKQASKRPGMAGRCFLVSLAIHALLIAGILLCSSYAGKRASPVIVLLTLQPREGGGGGGSHAGKKAVVMQRVRPGAAMSRQTPRPLPVAAKPVSEQAILADTSVSREGLAVPAQAVPEEPAPRFPPGSTPAGSPDGAASSGSGGGRGSGTGSGRGTGSGSGTGGGSGSGTGSSAGPGQSPADYLETLREQYRKEHFAYIRDLILRHLEYPQLAREMGWQGGVTVSFIVLETGHAERIRIVRSSGHKTLDLNVSETVREVQPFPRPPVRVEIVIPVVYRLE